MDIHYRLAKPADAIPLHEIKKITWPEEEVTLDQVRSVLNTDQRLCQVAEVNHQVVGFMDCFTTISNTGDLRLEMDLLAVLPEYQGNGIASRLIADCLAQASPLRYKYARSLIQVTNTGSQRAFQHNGFEVQDQVLNLYVAGNHQPVPSGITGYAVWVNTLGYMGYWLEPPLQEGTLELTRPYQTIGAVIPAGSLWEDKALQLGYELIHPYQWWIKPYAV